MNARKLLSLGAALALCAGLTGAVTAPVYASGPDTTYLVLAPNGQSTAAAAARVAAAGGTVVATYDQIGVLVVQSTSVSFADDAAGSGVEAVGDTTGLGATLDDDEVL